jgi:hypothetical protein
MTFTTGRTSTKLQAPISTPSISRVRKQTFWDIRLKELKAHWNVDEIPGVIDQLSESKALLFIFFA